MLKEPGFKRCPRCKQEKEKTYFYKNKLIKLCKPCRRKDVKTKQSVRTTPQFKGDPGGYGEQHYTDGGVFKGMFKNSKRDGPGSYVFADGVTERGFWKKGSLILKKERRILK